MQADQTANETEEAKETCSDSKTRPVGLPVSRKPVSEWSCKVMEKYYEIVTQVGEGTYRYLTPLTIKRCI